MDRQKIEDEVLRLSRQERVELIQRLVLSLDAPAPDELRAEWLEEAQCRARELDDGTVQTVPGGEVLRKARTLVK